MKKSKQIFEIRNLTCQSGWAQLIWKGHFGVFNSSKKLENFNFCPRLPGQKFFVRFLEELKTPKRPFKINWPLVFQNLCKFLTSEIQVPWNYQVTLYWRAFYPKVPNKVCVRIAVAVGLNLACGRFEKSKERFFFSPHSIELRHNGAKKVVKYHLNFQNILWFCFSFVRNYLCVHNLNEG